MILLCFIKLKTHERVFTLNVEIKRDSGVPILVSWQEKKKKQVGALQHTSSIDDFDLNVFPSHRSMLMPKLIRGPQHLYPRNNKIYFIF